MSNKFKMPVFLSIIVLPLSCGFSPADGERSFLSIFVYVLFTVIILVLLHFYIRITKHNAEYEKQFNNSIFQDSSIIIIAWDSRGDITRLNRYAQEVTGYSEGEIAGKKLFELLAPPNNESVDIEAFWKAVQEHRVHKHENRLRLKSGSSISVLWSSFLFKGDKGGKAYGLSMGMDITERKLSEERLRESYEELGETHGKLMALQEELGQRYSELKEKEEALRASEERYRLAVEGVNDGIWEWDVKNNLIVLSERSKGLLGYEGEEPAQGLESLIKLIHPEDIGRVTRNFRIYLNGGLQVCREEFRVRSASGEYKWILMRGQAVRDGNNKPVRIIGSHTDITQRKLSEEKINRLAYYDALTGLPNRTLFNDRMNVALSQAQRKKCMVGLFFLDLDNFKTVNDTLGHHYGDILLKNIGELLKSCLRKGDTVARLGGDEFIMLQHGVNSEDEVVRVAERILELFRKPLSLAGHQFFITASIGITLYPSDGEDLHILLKNADTAMYRAKEQGKNNYSFFTRTLNTELRDKLELEYSLRYALDKNELEVYYQPQLDLKTGKVAGAEALVRWNHPAKGAMLPEEFIPVAEEMGIVNSIGDWILQKAFRQTVEWHKGGYDHLFIAVNLSSSQFMREDLEAVLEAALEESGLPPRFLELEITESAVLKAPDYSADLLERLKRAGINASLDDFGTGYFSFNCIKKLPFNSLKIDKSLIRRIVSNPIEAAVTRAVISLAHELKLKVCAEGVETQDQLEFLMEEGCELAQGLLFGSPVPGDRFVGFIGI